MATLPGSCLRGRCLRLHGCLGGTARHPVCVDGREGGDVRIACVEGPGGPPCGRSIEPSGDSTPPPGPRRPPPGPPVRAGVTGSARRLLGFGARAGTQGRTVTGPRANRTTTTVRTAAAQTPARLSPPLRQAVWASPLGQRSLAEHPIRRRRPRWNACPRRGRRRRPSLCSVHPFRSAEESAASPRTPFMDRAWSTERPVHPSRSAPRGAGGRTAGGRDRGRHDA